MGVQLAPALANAFGLWAKLQIWKLVKEQLAHPASAAPSTPPMTVQFGSYAIPLPIPFSHLAEVEHTLRQVDDISMLVTRSARAAGAEQWITEVYRILLGLVLEWTPADPSGFTPWLNMNLRVNDQGSLQYKMYHKPGNTFSYPHAESHVPAGVHSGVLCGRILAVADIAREDADHRQRELNAVFARMIERGHSAAWVRRIAERLAHHCEEQPPNFETAPHAMLPARLGRQSQRAADEDEDAQRIVATFHREIDYRRAGREIAAATGQSIVWSYWGTKKAGSFLPRPKVHPEALRGHPQPDVIMSLPPELHAE